MRRTPSLERSSTCDREKGRNDRSDFNDEMIKLYGADARGYEFDGRTIKPLQNDLYHWDLISYTYRISNGRWHILQNELPGKKDPKQI